MAKQGGSRAQLWRIRHGECHAPTEELGSLYLSVQSLQESLHSVP